MDIRDIVAGLIVIITIIGFLILLVAVGFVVIVLSIYMSAYTIALLHILIVEPVIFDTYSLFTIPYNEIWTMANNYSSWIYLLAALYIIGFLEGLFGNKCDK